MYYMASNKSFERTAASILVRMTGKEGKAEIERLLLLK
jgi:hypothetical protein